MSKPESKDETDKKKDPEHEEIDQMLKFMRQESMNLGNQINAIDNNRKSSTSSSSTEETFKPSANSTPSDPVVQKQDDFVRPKTPEMKKVNKIDSY